jgi:hypothetical protein
MNNEEINEDDTPKGYRRLYVYDELDRFISASYGLEVDEYIRIMDTLMSEEDAQLFFDHTADGEIEKGRGVLEKYL